MCRTSFGACAHGVKSEIFAWHRHWSHRSKQESTVETCTWCCGCRFRQKKVALRTLRQHPTGPDFTLPLTSPSGSVLLQTIAMATVAPAVLSKILKASNAKNMYDEPVVLDCGFESVMRSPSVVLRAVLSSLSLKPQQSCKVVSMDLAPFTEMVENHWFRSSKQLLDIAAKAF